MSEEMRFIGLLTHEQKQAGYFVAQTEDFIFVFRGRNTSQPLIVGTFAYETVSVKQIRDCAEADRLARVARPLSS